MSGAGLKPPWWDVTTDARGKSAPCGSTVLDSQSARTGRAVSDMQLRREEHA